MTDFLALTQADLQQGLTAAQRTFVWSVLDSKPLCLASPRTLDSCPVPPAYEESSVRREAERKELTHAR